MKIFINKNTTVEDIKKYALNRIDEDSVQLICESGYHMSSDQLAGVSELPEQILEVTSVETDVAENFIDSIIHFIYRLHNDNWENAIKIISERDFYQGFTIEVDIDTLNQETLIDKLIFFYESLGLYRHNNIFMNVSTKELEFGNYNAFVAFMAEEMSNACFWKHINTKYLDDELHLYGLDECKVRCNSHCLGIINGDDYCVCEYNMTPVSKLEDRQLPASRKALMEAFRKQAVFGCDKHA